MKKFTKVARGIVNKLKAFTLCCLIEDDEEEFTEAQAKEIELGYKAGLTTNQIRAYARLDLAPFTMFMYRRCLELHSPIVEKLITPRHEDWQIAVICRSLLGGMTKDEVKPLADRRMSKEQIGLVLKGYKAGLTASQVKSFAKPHYSLTEMTYRLVCLISDNKVSREVAELLVSCKGGK